MPITETDIKLMASERLTQAPDGGGRMSGNAVIDGQENNLFPDVPDLAYVTGGVGIIKAYALVDTLDTDLFASARVYIAEQPADPRIRMCLFSTGSHTDERADLRDYIERYVAQGPRSTLKLLGSHFEGQSLILGYQSVGAAVPEIGEVLYLAHIVGGVVQAEQFVRVTGVSAETVTYEDDKGEFQRDQVTLEISDPLRTLFPGGEPNRLSSYQPPTEIRTTAAVDAARYFSSSPLAVAGEVTDLTVQVEDIYHPLLPATTAETPVVDAQAAGGAVLTIDAGARDVDVEQASETLQVYIDLQNRGLNYVISLQPLPAPRTAVFSFRAGGRWYTIRDDEGTGQLTGSGGGSINYLTGTALITLAALPDVDTSILAAWGTPVDYTVRDDAVLDPPAITGTLAASACVPNTFAAAWLSGGAPKAAADDGAGNITGDATGRIVYGTGEYYMEPAALPDPNTLFTIDSEAADGFTEDFTPTKDGSGGVECIVANGPVEPFSVAVEWETRYFYSNGVVAATRLNRARDDGAGGLVFEGGGAVPLADVNYATGRVYFQSEGSYQAPVPLYEYYTYTPYYRSSPVRRRRRVGYNYDVAAYLFTDGGLVRVRYREDSAVPTVRQDQVPAPALTLDLTPAVVDSIVPGSVQFALAGNTYIDTAGTIIRNPDPETGAGTPAGTLDYSTGVATLTNWIAGAPTLVVQSLLTAFGQPTRDAVQFRTAGAPIRVASLTVQANYLDGTLVTGTSNNDDDIVGTGLDGHIDSDTGVAEVLFGEWVTAAGNEGEPWYDAGAVVEGEIWRPAEIIPGSVRYNAVVIAYLPLSAEVLGVDPVRLPIDGRVPWVRPADVVVIHHTATVAGHVPVAGATLDLGRERLARVRVYDAEGTTVVPGAATYSVDLDTGILTWADPLDLGAYTGPYDIAHTIEDWRLVTQADIDGTITIGQPLTHDFPVPGTIVSSALIIGDLFARATSTWSQAAWTGEWSDEQIGAGTTGQYNDVLYPAEVTNRGTVQDRVRITFTSSTTFAVVFEDRGQVAIGDINTDLSPINPATGVPYFTLRSAGWGAGWVSGNTLRLNFIAAAHPIDYVRTVLMGEAGSGIDKFRSVIRGGVNA